MLCVKRTYRLPCKPTRSAFVVLYVLLFLCYSRPLPFPRIHFGISIPFHIVVMDTVRVRAASPKTSNTQSSRSQPLPPHQHTSGPPLITRNVPTPCVHSLPSSSSANCLPCVLAATTMTRSASCSTLLDEEVSTTIETHHSHLPYCHPRLAFACRNPQHRS